MKIFTCTLYFLFTTFNCFAIEYYAPGDSLWVWAKNGLNIRETPSEKSRVIGQVEHGEPVVALDYQDRNLPYEVEEIKAKIETVDNQKVTRPNFVLNGYWAKVKYKGMTGYVFDAYLSKLHAFTGRQYESQGEEDFHVWSLKKHTKILKQIGQNKYDERDQKFVRYIFDNGCIIHISGGSGSWTKEMLFPDNLSLIEGFLIYSNTMRLETDALLEKGEDYLLFEIETGTLTIKKVGTFLVIYEEHNC